MLICSQKEPYSEIAFKNSISGITAAVDKAGRRRQHDLSFFTAANPGNCGSTSEEMSLGIHSPLTDVVAL